MWFPHPHSLHQDFTDPTASRFVFTTSGRGGAVVGGGMGDVVGLCAHVPSCVGVVVGVGVVDVGLRLGGCCPGLCAAASARSCFWMLARSFFSSSIVALALVFVLAACTTGVLLDSRIFLYKDVLFPQLNVLCVDG